MPPNPSSPDCPTCDFTIGVEEEFLVVDATTGILVPRGSEVVTASDGEFEPEFHQALIENASEVCEDLHQLDGALRAGREKLAGLAGTRSLRIVSAGSTPLSDLEGQQVTDESRFRRMLDDYQQLAREQLICGSQTHVGFVDRDESVEVMNRVRAWLPALLALSASSPFFEGADTGYDSYRVQIWSRWPTSGMPAEFRSWQEYQDITKDLVGSGAIADLGMLYWWLRPSQHAPTIEFRIADAATTLDEAVMLAGLSRGIARAACLDLREGRPAAAVRPEWLSVSVWRASRFGLDGELLDPISGRAASARQVVRSLIDQVEERIGETGERDRVLGTVERVLAAGNSATRQRGAYARRERLQDVVEHVADETVGGLTA